MLWVLLTVTLGACVPDKPQCRDVAADGALFFTRFEDCYELARSFNEGTGTEGGRLKQTCISAYPAPSEKWLGDSHAAPVETSPGVFAIPN